MSKRALLAEDNPFNQKVGRLLLEAGGYEVQVVGDGLEAVKAFRQQEFDLVLLDCHMPVMDGFTAARLIRALPSPRGRIKILALTASGGPETPEACQAAGMDACLSKPLNPEMLNKILEELGE